MFKKPGGYSRWDENGRTTLDAAGVTASKKRKALSEAGQEVGEQGGRRLIRQVGEMKHGMPKLFSRKAGTSFSAKYNSKRIINYSTIFSLIWHLLLGQLFGYCVEIQP